MNVADASNASGNAGNTAGDVSDRLPLFWMDLTPLQRNWALALKQAVQGVECLRIANPPVTDMQIAQFAIVHCGNTDQALHCMTNLQHFKEEYKVQDTVEEAMQVLSAHADIQPKYLLHVETSVSHETGGPHSSWIVDAAAFDASAALRNWRTVIVASYYLYQACFSHFSAVQEGCVILMECAGLDWRFQRDILRTVQKDVEELINWYPMHTKLLMCYNTPTFMSVVWAFCKGQLRDEKLKHRAILGCKLEDRQQPEQKNSNTGIGQATSLLYNDADQDSEPTQARITDLFTSPVCSDKSWFLNRIQPLLIQRYYHEAAFRL